MRLRRLKLKTAWRHFVSTRAERPTTFANKAIPHKHWASYAFPGRRFDHVTSNLSEIANSALRRHRELPPLQSMASMYDYEMMHFHKRALAALKWQQTLASHPYDLLLICPQAQRLKCN
ncbi:hypothetical protein CF336_g8863 [Tilletia laevis]|nr:hypothetical protein CF336_g8863 [Tilletia laevis]CAD7061435.1 unnamed protein product [Tilletia caries]